MISKMIALLALLDARRERNLRLIQMKAKMGVGNVCLCSVCKDINEQRAYLTYDPRVWDHARFLMEMDNVGTEPRVKK